MKITYFRHGFKQWSNGKNGFNFDPPLKDGKYSTDYVVKDVPELIVISPYLRCRQTYESLINLNPQLKNVKTSIDPLAREYLGNWKNKKYRDKNGNLQLFENSITLDFITFMKCQNTIKVETYKEFQKRISDLKDKYFNDKYQSIMFITHGIVISHLTKNEIRPKGIEIEEEQWFEEEI